jgi:hypothetical protein
MRYLLSTAIIFASSFITCGVAVADVFPDYQRLYNDQFVKMLACGPLAILSVAEKLQLPITETDRRSILSVSETDGTDLLMLKAIAEQHGMHALGIESSFHGLRRIALPAILVRNKATFVAAVNYERSGISIRGPLESSRTVSEQEFIEKFGATFPCLVLSRSPINAKDLGLEPSQPAKVRGPRLRFDKTVLSLGRLSQHEWVGKLRLQNVGTETLKIEDVVSSCSCMTGSVEVRSLEPNEWTYLSVRGTQQNTGVVSQQLVLRTNEKNRPHAQLPVRGWLAPPVYFIEPVVVFKEPRSRTSRDVRLIVPAGTNPTDLRATVSADSPLAVSILPSEAQDAAVLRLELTPTTIEGGQQITGWEQWEVSVIDSSNVDEAAIPAKMTVVMEARPIVSASPQSLWIRDRELGQSWNRSIHFDFGPTLNDEVKYSWTDTAFADAIEVSVTHPRKNEVQLDLRPKEAGLNRDIAGRSASLKCEADGKTIVIPIQLGRPQLSDKD